MPATLLICLTCAVGAHAADTYNPLSAQLVVPSMVVGNATYSNVVVKVLPANVVSIHGGTPAGSVDTYDPSTQLLSVPSVNVNGTIYTNVVVTVGGPVTIGAAAGIDTYNATSSQLRIAAVQVGAATYYNVVVSAGLADIAKLAGGMPSATQDVFNAGTGQLLVPAVQANGRIYTNVTLNVGLPNVVSLGAASVFEDAPVQGLCYSTSPSATAGASPTNRAGQFLYSSGDSVTFWIDGSGAGCNGTTASSATSVLLGSMTPTGKISSVLALAGGAQTADTLTALNVGTSSLMNVGGLLLNPSDVSTLNQYIRTEGYSETSIPASLDALFHAVQADTKVAADGSIPAFVTPVVPGMSQNTSVLETTVTGKLLATGAALPGQPTTFPVPSGGELLFNIAYVGTTCPICVAPSTIYDGAFAEITYLDGQGHSIQVYNPGLLQATVPLADVTLSGTYSVSGNVLTLSENGTDVFSGDAYSYREVRTEEYRDALSSIDSLDYTSIYSSGPNAGQTFSVGTGATSGVRLTPLTLAMLAGRSITQEVAGCPGNKNMLTFVGVGSGPASVTLTSSCGGNAVSLVPSAVPGILLGTDSTGFTMFVGLDGSRLAAGASFALIQVALGSQLLSGNGNSWQWEIGQPFLAVN